MTVLYKYIIISSPYSDYVIIRIIVLIFLNYLLHAGYAPSEGEEVAGLSYVFLNFTNKIFFTPDNWDHGQLFRKLVVLSLLVMSISEKNVKTVFLKLSS